MKETQSNKLRDASRWTSAAGRRVVFVVLSQHGASSESFDRYRDALSRLHQHPRALGCRMVFNRRNADWELSGTFDARGRRFRA